MALLIQAKRLNHFICIGLLFFFTLFAQAAEITADSINTRDGEREFLVARSRPASRFTPGTPAARPLVLLLHGHTGTARQILGRGLGAAPLSVWLQLADKHGLVLAALQGRAGADHQTGWNDCRRDAQNNPNTDDVAFAQAVVKKLVASGEVDPSRVYAMGMSNGAMMTLRLAQEMQPPLAAFAAVSGLMAADSECATPPHAVPALFIMGTGDPLVPFTGGQVQASQTPRGGVWSTERSLAFWRQRNDASLAKVPLQIKAKDSSTSVERLAYAQTAEGADSVVLLRINGGGHIEPSRSQRIGRLYQRIVGEQNHDVEAAEEAWQFFSAWPAAAH